MRVANIRPLLVFIFCLMTLVIAILGVGYSACNERPIKSSESAETAQPYKNSCSSPITILKVGLYEAWSFVHSHHEETIAVGTIFIAIFTVVLGLFTVSLAGATDKLVRGAERTERRQLRAYVGLDKLEFESAGLKDKNYMPADLTTPGLVHKDFIAVKVRNYGQTPAYGVTIYAYLVATDFPARLPDEFFSLNDVDIISMADIRPTLARFLLHQNQRELSKTPLTDITVLKEAVAKKKQVYVYGRIYYRDIYDRPWRTKFCYSWEPWHPTSPRFVAYEEYNGEDQKELEEWRP